jgi:hypothetical protein
MWKCIATWPHSFLISCLLCSCIPIAISGSNVPTEHTFQLTEKDIAAASSEECVQEWVTDDPVANHGMALALLEERGVKVTERSAIRFVTAFERRLRLGDGFWDKPTSIQAEILSHELVHYCQRDQLGDRAFELAYAHSAGRWRIEVPAFAQNVRTMREQGVSHDELQMYIDSRIVSLRNFYLLWDIAPDQYEKETRPILESAM